MDRVGDRQAKMTAHGWQSNIATEGSLIHFEVNTRHPQRHHSIARCDVEMTSEAGLRRRLKSDDGRRQEVCSAEGFLEN